MGFHATREPPGKVRRCARGLSRTASFLAASADVLTDLHGRWVANRHEREAAKLLEIVELVQARCRVAVASWVKINRRAVGRDGGKWRGQNERQPASRKNCAVSNQAVLNR